MKFAADNLSFLLSTDWFLPAWNLCGLQATSRARLEAQKQCRGIVELLVRNCETYWDAEFSESRGEQTKDDVIRALNAAKLGQSDLLIFEKYLNDTDSAEESVAEDSLVSSLFSLLVHEAGEGNIESGLLSASTIQVVQRALAGQESEFVFFEVWRKSSSKWDAYLSQLTPDLPSFTVDTARELSRRAGGVEKMTSKLRTELSEEEFIRLVGWLRKAALELADKDLSNRLV